MASSGSLQDLNPIILPDAVGILPLAPGWQVLLTIAGLTLLWQAWKYWLAWRANRYRREALQELQRLERPRDLPDLLKRTALSAFARSDIAALSGPEWHRFLDQSAGLDQFTGACGAWLDQLAYGDPALTPEQYDNLLEASRTWLKQHRRAV